MMMKLVMLIIRIILNYIIFINIKENNYMIENNIDKTRISNNHIKCANTKNKNRNNIKIKIKVNILKK